jgi:hypothetical protein
MADIIVEFDEQGNQTIRIEKVAGPSCEKYQKMFGLGPVTFAKNTDDYYKQEKASVAVGNKQSLSSI